MGLQTGSPQRGLRRTWGSILMRKFRVQRKRPRTSFFLGLLSKIRLSQCIICIGSFFLVMCIIPLFYLPRNVTEREKISRKTLGFFRGSNELNLEGISFLKELDFGENLKIAPFKILENFENNSKVGDECVVESRKVTRYGHRKPRLAMVFGDLWGDTYQVQMATVATALQHIGYEIEVFTLEHGPAFEVWSELGVRVNVISADENMKFNVDWLNYNGILVSSLKAVGVISCLKQEPFKSIPLVWTIHEQMLAARLEQYVSNNQNEQINNWKQVFSRATAIVFPNYILSMVYSICDPGNYLVIPGSPQESWKADKLMVSSKESLPLPIESAPDDFVIAVVGCQFLYKGLWLEHSLVLQALYPLLTGFHNSSSSLKIIILAGDSKSNYKKAVKTIAQNLSYPKDTVKCVSLDEAADNILRTADIVIHGSFLEEHTFPGILLKAMFLGKPIIAPDLPMISKYIWDRVNGYLFPKEDVNCLTEIMLQMVSNGSISLLARNAALNGKHTAKLIMVSEGIQGYASLLENILILPSEVAVPKAVKDIPTEIQTEWMLHTLEYIEHTDPAKETRRKFLDEVEKQFISPRRENTMVLIAANDSLLQVIWEEQKHIDIKKMIESIEDEELMERTDLLEERWDKIYRNERKADHFLLHERNGEELERTGQALCIYEPYFGEGAWPFLHRTSLYRGLRLSTKGKRPGADDIDAPTRLPLLNDLYYRDAMGDFGAFLAIANRIDQIHKNSWIGFQSWRATARKESLSKTAEKSLLEAIEAQKHGDTLYFWARMDKDPRSPEIQDFWSFCDAISAGNCRLAFSEAMKRMYGTQQNFGSLPLMPSEKNTFSVMHCWVLPTKSFMEFVMFARMFIDALDTVFYDDHQRTGCCYLSFSKGNQCYSRILELLINVWAYHSGRRMVFVNPETGLKQEQHLLEGRRGSMWIQWFQFSTLKSMDQDLAEEFDYENPERHWLWPSTGEVFWKGIYEKEKILRHKEKERRKQLRIERIQRMKQRPRQKALGKYVNPEESNSTKSYRSLLI